jgi:hypothetical protein
MSYVNPDSEDAAIEQPTIALFAELGWETLNCYHENFGPLSLLGRVSGVNYFFGLTTTISPDQRQLLCSS